MIWKHGLDNHFLQSNKSKGSITIIGLCLILMTSVVSISLIIRELGQLKKINERANTYLCLKSEIVSNVRYVKSINIFNGAILSANVVIALSIYALSPVVAFEALEARKKIIALQNIVRSLHLAQKVSGLTRSKHCSQVQTLIFNSQLLYKMKRSMFGFMELRKNDMKMFMKGDTGWDLLLQTNLQVENDFSIYPHVETKELIHEVGLLLWKRLVSWR